MARPCTPLDLWRRLSRRQRLRLVLLFVGLQSAYVLLMHSQLMELFVEDEDFPTMKPINRTFEEMDSKRYLQDLLRGKASVAPAVEREHTYELYLGCRLSESKNVSRGWLPVNRWHLYSAYEDRRWNSLYPKLKTSIQIIASTFHVVDAAEAWYCHVRSAEGAMLRVRAHFRLIWQRAWDTRRTFHNPYLVTCGLPNDFDVRKGAAVLLRGKKCPGAADTFLAVRPAEGARAAAAAEPFSAAAPAFRLRADAETRGIALLVESMVRNGLRKEEGASAGPAADAPADAQQQSVKVAVCVKGLDFFEDRTLDLLEWLLLQYALGADSVTLYIYHLPARTSRMLQLVKRSYDLKLIDLDLPGNVSRNDVEQHNYIWKDYSQKRRNELIPYNDCFYSYAHTHDYVLLVDTDEVVVPVQHERWPAMIADFVRGFRRNATSLAASNVFKFADAADADGLLGRRYRARAVQERGVLGKSFISTKTAATVFNHFALHRLHANVSRTAYFPPDMALKLHWRADCPKELAKECASLRADREVDRSLDRWAGEVRRKAKDIMKRVDSNK